MYGQIFDSLQKYNTVGISFQIQSLFKKRGDCGDCGEGCTCYPTFSMRNYHVAVPLHIADDDAMLEYLFSCYQWRNWFWSRAGLGILVNAFV